MSPPNGATGTAMFLTAEGKLVMFDLLPPDAEHFVPPVRVRFHIIRNARIENVGKSQSCMVSELRIIWKQTVPMPTLAAVEATALVAGVAAQEQRR